MRVGILGTGDVGKVLSNGFVGLGHEVKMGSRDANNTKIKEWQKEAGAKASGGTFKDAATFGEVIVLATLGVGTEDAIRAAGPENFAGKVVLDATNPLDFSAGAPRLAFGHSDSLGERVQRWLPKAKVVKAYNTVGSHLMVNPGFTGTLPDMFICGNDEGAKSKVTEICKNFGWGTVDLGGIEGARYLEPMCMAWCLYGFKTDTWNHAFKLLRK